MTSSRWLGVVLMGLPSYRRENNQLKNTLLAIDNQGKNWRQFDGLKMIAYSGDFGRPSARGSAVYKRRGTGRCKSASIKS